MSQLEALNLRMTEGREILFFIAQINKQIRTNVNELDLKIILEVGIILEEFKNTFI